MKSILPAALYLCFGLAAGFGLSAYFSGGTSDALEDPGAANARVMAGSSNGVPLPGLTSRLERLEANVAALVARNVELESRLERLDGLLEAAGADSNRYDSSVEGQARAVAETRREGPATADGEPGRRFRNRDLGSALTSAGFSDADAERIETRIEQLRLEAMQSRYDALRSGEPEAEIQARLQELQRTDVMLRAELGDADYERYLAATGRSTSVGVGAVIPSSAAETAGIRPGDEIRTYGGERVFDTRDLNRLLLEGEPGEPVLVDIVRDGQPMQVVIPRGPLGISSGFGRRSLR